MGAIHLFPEVGLRIYKVIVEGGFFGTKPECKRHKLRRLEDRHLLLVSVIKPFGTPDSVS